MNRAKRLCVEIERASVEAKAARAGVELSEWIRSGGTATRGESAVVVPEINREVWLELAGLAANFNRAMALINEERDIRITRQFAENLRDHLAELRRDLLGRSGRNDRENLDRQRRTRVLGYVLGNKKERGLEQEQERERGQERTSERAAKLAQSRRESTTLEQERAHGRGRGATWGCARALRGSARAAHLWRGSIS